MEAQPSASQFSAAEQAAIVRKINLRLLPLLFTCYIIAYIDRINVGFAKLHLQDALKVDPAVFNSVFGLGAGLFFIGYFIFEVPSNLVLQRVGARIWIARIMIVWGIVSGGFMFLEGKWMFYIMRFMLGAAEAGFFPGVLLYFTYWYPAHERARTIALFAIGGVAAGVIGSPISGALLRMDGLGGLHGWQWLFLIEALPAVLLGVIVLIFLPNRPRNAKWLNDREKAWVESRLEQDGKAAPEHGGHMLGEIFTSPRVWAFCAVYFLLNIGSYGFEMWSPTIVKGLSAQNDLGVGFINAIPYIGAAIAMYLVGHYSDRSGIRRGVVAIAAVSASVGFVLAALNKNPIIAMIGLTIAFAGLKSTIAPFWAFSTTFLTGAAAAGGIALVNSVGNLGGFFGPYMFGYVKDKTGSDYIALLVLGGALLTMGVLAILTPKTGSIEDRR